MPDDNSPMRPEPSKQRLDAPSSRVIVKNTSEVQNHIVIDRFNVGHELRPGEAREMEMLNEEIANRFRSSAGLTGSSQARRRSSRCTQSSSKAFHRWCRLAGTMNSGPGSRIAHVARRSG